MEMNPGSPHATKRFINGYLFGNEEDYNSLTIHHLLPFNKLPAFRHVDHYHNAVCADRLRLRDECYAEHHPAKCSNLTERWLRCLQREGVHAKTLSELREDSRHRHHFVNAHKEDGEAAH